MSITPIEMLSMAPKSQEASLVKHHENQKPIQDQIQILDKFTSDIKDHAHQVIEAKKTDTPEFRYDAKKEGGNSFHKQQKKRKQKQQSSDKKDDNKQEPKVQNTKSIDIRI